MARTISKRRRIDKGVDRLAIEVILHKKPDESIGRGRELVTSPQKTTKKAKTRAVLVRLKESTIEYLRGRTDEDAPSVPSVIRRDIEAKRREDEKKGKG